MLGCVGLGSRAPTPQEEGIEQALPRQVDVIKKAYLQEEERENSEVSPREVGHNIYILALQVPALPPPTCPTPCSPALRAPLSPRPRLGDGAGHCLSLSSPGTTSSCSTC